MDKFQPTESTKYPGYYLIPGYSLYAISKTGILIQLVDYKRKKAGAILPTIEAKSKGYNTFVFNLYKDPCIKKHTVSLNKITCFAFYGISTIDKPTALNISGDVKNTNYDNYKWMSKQDTSNISVYTFSRKGKKPNRKVYVYNLLSNEVIEHVSIKKLALEVKLSFSNISRLLRNNIYKNNSHYLFSYNKDEDWNKIIKDNKLY